EALRAPRDDLADLVGQHGVFRSFRRARQPMSGGIELGPEGRLDVLGRRLFRLAAPELGALVVEDAEEKSLHAGAALETLSGVEEGGEGILHQLLRVARRKSLRQGAGQERAR